MIRGIKRTMIVDQMKQAADPLMQAIYKQPFQQELLQGHLPPRKFIFYLVQESFYWPDFSKALSLIAARLAHDAHTQLLMRLALQGMAEEQQLQAHYLATDAFSDRSALSQSPTCFMYANYLLRMAALESVEEAVASLLPCFWVYYKVGYWMSTQQKCSNHPYQSWIDFYVSDRFKQSVDQAIQVTNQLGETANLVCLQKMLSAFVQSTRLEALFWDSAYREEVW